MPESEVEKMEAAEAAAAAAKAAERDVKAELAEVAFDNPINLPCAAATKPAACSSAPSACLPVFLPSCRSSTKGV